MDKDSDESNEIVIQKILKRFNELDQAEFQKDLAKAPKSATNIIYLKEFVQRYSKKELNEQNTKEILHEIISKLVNLRQDFLSCIKIFLTIEDQEKAEALRCHYILKEEKLNKFKDGGINGNGDSYIEFGVSLSCIFEIETYYKKFIKGILGYFQAVFKENYLYEYIKSDDLKNFSELKFYEKNISSFNSSLNKMLIDMERVIFEHTNELENINSEKKMPFSTFDIFQIRANLGDNDTIKEIYQKCNNNHEILREIRKLKEKTDEKKEKELFVNLRLFEYDVEKYIKEENDKIKIYNEFAKQKAINKKQEAINKKQEAINKKQEATNKEHVTTIKNIETTIKKHETTIKNQETTIRSHGETISKLQNEINELNEKVNFLEPLVLSLYAENH
jgi:hypothetical protein